jgi:hypothetical protein
MLKCPNKEARETRKAALAAFRVEGKKKRIPRTVIDRIHYPLSHYMQGREGGVTTSDKNALYVATNQQKMIGLELLPRRILARGWSDAMEDGGAEQPDHKMTHLQRTLWSTVMVPLWNKRCNIQHGKGNRAEEINGLRLGACIQ